MRMTWFNAVMDGIKAEGYSFIYLAYWHNGISTTMKCTKHCEVLAFWTSQVWWKMYTILYKHNSIELTVKSASKVYCISSTIAGSLICNLLCFTWVRICFTHICDSPGFPKHNCQLLRSGPSSSRTRHMSNQQVLKIILRTRNFSEPTYWI